MTEPIIHGTNRPWSRRLLALCGAGALALGTTFATWAVDDPKPDAPAAPTAPVGLRGILPADVPGSLSEDAFAALEGNWLDWGTKTAAEVAKLYTDDSLDLAGQRQQLEVLKKKLATLTTSLKDVRYRSIHETLASLHAALSRRVALAEAVLDTMAIDPEKAASARLETARDELAKSLRELETDLNKRQNGPAWLAYVRSAEIVKLVSEKKGKDALPVLLVVQNKLSPTETMSPEIRKFLDGERLVAMRKSVDNFVIVAAEADRPVDADKLRTELTHLVAAVEKFEDSRQTPDAAAVRKAFDAVRKASPDGGDRISTPMSTHYLNYNLRVVVSEKFLTRVASQTETKQGPVKDFILGANVSGQQTTTATAGVDLKPANNGIRFHITLQGIPNPIPPA